MKPSWAWGRTRYETIVAGPYPTLSNGGNAAMGNKQVPGLRLLIATCERHEIICGHPVIFVTLLKIYLSTDQFVLEAILTVYYIQSSERESGQMEIAIIIAVSAAALTGMVAIAKHAPEVLAVISLWLALN